MTSTSRKAMIFPLIVLALTIPIVLGFNAIFFDNEPGTYVVKAELTDASGVVPEGAVKIGGVTAGTVDAIELTKRDTALVTMLLDDGAAPIGRGATVAARPVNLLGEKYLDLKVGDISEGNTLPSGTTVPLSRTTTPVELDDLLNMLQPGVRARLRILINEAGVAMAGRGADFNGLLEQMPPAIDQVGQLVADVNASNRQLALVIEQGDRVLGEITPNRDALGDFVDSAGQALKVTTSRRLELARTLQTAPPALTKLRGTLSQLDGTSRALRPAAVELRNAAPWLNETLVSLPDFTNAAHETMLAGRDVAPTLTRLAREATPVVDRLRPTAERLERFSDHSRPLTRALGRGRDIELLLETMNNWANTIKTSDGLSHLFGLRFYATADQVNHLVEAATGLGIVRTGGTTTGGGGAGSQSLPGLPNPPDVSDTVGDVGDTVDEVTDTVEDTIDQVLPLKPTDPARTSSNPLQQRHTGPQAGGEAARLFDYLFGP